MSETKPLKPIKQLTVRQLLQHETTVEQITRAVPKHCDPDRLLRVALTCVNGNEQLAKADQASFMAALMSLSRTGLEPDGRHAYLIPFNNRKKNIVEVQLIISYMGLMKLVRRSKEVTNIRASVIHENDYFKYRSGSLQEIEHVPTLKNRGPVIGVYAIAELKDGGHQMEVMNIEEIEAIRKRSRAADSGPWVTDYNEMAKKTVFRRLSKWLPMDYEEKVIELINADDGQFMKNITPQREHIGGPKLFSLGGSATSASDVHKDQSGVKENADAAGAMGLPLLLGTLSEKNISANDFLFVVNDMGYRSASGEPLKKMEDITEQDVQSMLDDIEAVFEGIKIAKKVVKK